MKKTLIRAISFFLTLSLLTGLLIPFASAIEYEGVESMTVDATAALLIDLDTDQVLYEQAADEQRYPASITKIMTALLTLEAIGRGELDLNTEITVDAAALAESLNRFLESLPQEKRVTFTTYNPYKKGTPLLPSGLLGPVRVAWAE